MDVEGALNELLGDSRTGDLKSDLIRAVRESWRRRHVNSEAGGTAIQGLHELVGMSYREISREVDIPLTTLHRWTAPPGSTDQ